MEMETIQQWRREMNAYVRANCSPHAGDADATERTCPRCGAIYMEWKDNDTRPCPGCARAAEAEHNASVSAKSGPGYEKVVRGQLRHWRAEAERLGIT